MEIRRMQRHLRFEIWNDMKHEPGNFGRRKLFFFLRYAKLFPYTISDG